MIAPRDSCRNGRSGWGEPGLRRAGCPGRPSCGSTESPAAAPAPPGFTAGPVRACGAILDSCWDKHLAPGAETDPALSGIGGVRIVMGSPTPGSCSAMPGRTTRDRCLQPPVFQSMPNVNAGAFFIHRGSPQSVPWRLDINFAQRVHEPRLSELRRVNNFSEIPPGSDCFGYPDSGVDAHRSPHPKSAVAERYRVDPCPLASAGRGVVRTQQTCDHWWWARSAAHHPPSSAPFSLVAGAE